MELFFPYIAALLLIIPFLIIFRQYGDRFVRLKEKELEIIKNAGQEVKYYAYDRITLFLERIKPSNLIQNFDKELEPQEFVFLAEKMIHEEFEYNVSQQLYISTIVWEDVVYSKNKVVRLLYSVLEKLNTESNLQDFKTIFLMSYLDGEDYVSKTIQNLKNEIKKG